MLLIEARSNHAQTQYAYVVAAAHLWRAMGSPTNQQ
jgi:outer membrane protein TolC